MDDFGDTSWRDWRGADSSQPKRSPLRYQRRQTQWHEDQHKPRGTSV